MKIYQLHLAHKFKLLRCTIVAIALLTFFMVPACEAASMQQTQVEQTPLASIITETAHALMRDNAIAGMAIGITTQGKQQFFYYGLACTDTGQEVNENTLFEIGSVSKIFTGTLGGYAQARGALALSDRASKHFPPLAKSSFANISLLSLGGYTAGGLPLQFPAAVDSQAAMLRYFQNWQPSYPPATYRLYSNPSIGLLGHIVAKAMGAPFEELMEKTLFPAFGLRQTYLRVPEKEMRHYAYGYSNDGSPVRVGPGVFAAEAYGVKTTAADLLAFVAAHGNSSALKPAWRQAIATSQTGLYSVGAMTQGLGWEMYAYPPDMEAMIAQAPALILEPQPVTAPLPQASEMFLHKTGSTNGFGAYVVLVPAKDTGIVMLANKNYPNVVRMRAAARILAAVLSQ